MRRKHKKPATTARVIEFEIGHIDPLGQGVSRQSDGVTFIAGTLPGETGTAEVYKRSKGVQFARLKTLKTAAENRIEPLCPHFSRCPGCQYLHTDYDSEIGFKKASLSRYLSALDIEDSLIDVVPAPRRLHYRNRIQLHYRHKYIGMLDTVDNEVLQVPDCKIMREEIQPVFDALYLGEWSSDHRGHGHCELYLKSGEVSLQWNKTYAHGGFTQVYQEMNEVLQQRVQALLVQVNASRLLDLFSGVGNLSDAFAAAGGGRVLVDRYTSQSSANIHSLDLYDEQAMAHFTRKSGTSGFDTILVDPPRRGFPALDSWVKKIKPRHLLYVSCNPASLAYDLRGLSKKFRIKSVQLLDLFPATAHFETLVMLEFRK